MHCEHRGKQHSEHMPLHSKKGRVNTEARADNFTSYSIFWSLEVRDAKVAMRILASADEVSVLSANE